MYLHVWNQKRASSVRTRLSLQLEVAALRHQLSVYRAKRLAAGTSCWERR
jgi:hypothetical protein